MTAAAAVAVVLQQLQLVGSHVCGEWRLVGAACLLSHWLSVHVNSGCRVGDFCRVSSHRKASLGTSRPLSVCDFVVLGWKRLYTALVCMHAAGSPRRLCCHAPLYLGKQLCKLAALAELCDSTQLHSRRTVQYSHCWRLMPQQQLARCWQQYNHHIVPPLVIC